MSGKARQCRADGISQQLAHCRDSREDLEAVADGRSIGRSSTFRRGK
jgi:hypothetical protein